VSTDESKEERVPGRGTEPTPLAATIGERILGHLAQVAAERARRGSDAEHAERVAAIKRFQHARFEATYRDMLESPRYSNAARFFLEDLYGPHDFSQRDGEFARIVPALVRLFPREIVSTVESLAALHQLSEFLDGRMADSLSGLPVTGAGYGEAWRAVGRPADRERQVDLMLSVGRALDRYTRKPLLRQTLRLMRGPAQAAGLAALQRFLERGFDTFAQMRGAGAFLELIAVRESALAAKLFEGGDSSSVCG
jgi:hypothetical protein